MYQGQFPASAPPYALAALALSMLLSFPAQAAPAGGVVVGGSAGIATSGTRTTITQTTPGAVINWQGFGIAAGEAVQFVQPGSSSVTLNRVTGPDPSAIFGSLSANGRIFLVNPGGVLFGPGASVNVGGLVASTLDIGDGDFMAGRYKFSGTSRASVVNQGTINADGGFVALLGTQVSNTGTISARGGSEVLAAGEAITLDVLGDNLLNVTVDRAALDALVSNGGLLQADGGQVVLTTQAAGSLLSTAVNNTGVIQAQTIANQSGTIRLLGNMDGGTITVGGRLDASAPSGGNGGFIETSAARVNVQAGVQASTSAAGGRTGEWLIAPRDFTIGTGAGDNISGATLSALLVTNSVTITTAAAPGTQPDTGDIRVNDALSWTAAPDTTTLTLNASRDVNVNRAITAVNGNLVVCCGRDVNVDAAITTTNGSVLLNAGRNAVFTPSAAMTTTDGNLMVCAANDISIASAFVLTRGSSIPAQSLGLPTGLVLSAGTGGTGPGEAGGTVVFAPLAPPATVTGPNADVTVNYNPVSYTTPTSYAGNFTLSKGATLTQHMLVFGVSAPKTADGTTATTLVGLAGNPAGVSLVAGPGSSANFDTPVAGSGKSITFTGYTLQGPDQALYALPVSCCGPVLARTTGTVLAAAVVPPPPVVVTPPVVTPVPAPPLPVPVVIVPPPVVLVPEGDNPVASSGTTVLPQFAAFLVAPRLLQATEPLLAVVPATQPDQEIVLGQAAAAPVRSAAPASVVAPSPAPAPAAAPWRAPVRPAKPYRN
jgi:filamentous hemagglutinin family protein